MATKVWKSKTKSFNGRSMALIKNQDLVYLKDWIRAIVPLVALLILTELRLNGDEERLHALLADAEINEIWKKYNEDPKVTETDFGYARVLHEISREL